MSEEFQQESPCDTLPDDREFWTPTDLAAILDLTPNAVTHHCRYLFPHHKGHYRLDHASAARVLRYIRRFGIKSRRRDEKKL